MQPSNPRNRGLEQFISRTLKHGGHRHAPPTLEARVRRALEQRALLPWWHGPFAHWPAVARGAFLLGSLGCLGLALIAVTWLSLNVRALSYIDWLMQPRVWMSNGVHVASALSGVFSVTLRSLPVQWIYGGAVFTVACYTTVFGLSAAAYRTLFINPAPQR